MTSLVRMVGGLRVVPNHRWHTLAFLAGSSGRSPVYLGVEVDASAILARQSESAGCSVVAQVVAAVGTVWARHPEANSSFESLGLPLVVRHRDVDVKLAFDVSVDGTRTVQSAVLPAAQSISPAAITEWITDTRERLESGDRGPAQAFRFLPGVVGRAVFDIATFLPWSHRALGTVAVTSLGHRPIRHFYSDGGTTMTVGIGRMIDSVALVDDRAVDRTILPLSLTFDHRVIDGALAAEVAADLASELEMSGSTTAAELERIV
ncbi:2-oxo acid dehydrogenase subunit E2 [Rhodococcus sp. 1168]|uniref:2-oxo acid dehydrogenase subunit E2 n=1 Tax=Rhodococcus sp. 1168 TaxID=2018041 RepID=UPI0015940059|nr:2-oxo acid dehydrogenase subunit E2 [Rhodococcus sp. 1168]